MINFLKYFSRFNIELSDEQIFVFNNLINAFQVENNKINLSAIRDKEGIIKKHILDSLLSIFVFNDDHKKIIDLGTGGGFPAFPLSIFFPDKNFVAFDSINKKIVAAENIRKSLNIKNLKFLCNRAEELARDVNHREKYDILVSRAVTSMPTLIELSHAFVKKNGILVFYRGPNVLENEVEIFKKWNLKLRHHKYFELPDGEKRFITVLEKMLPTPKNIPRENGLPKKNPLYIEK